MISTLLNIYLNYIKYFYHSWQLPRLIFVSSKTSAYSSVTKLKTLMCGSQQTGKSFKRWEYQTTLPASWEACLKYKKQLLESDMELQTGLKLGERHTSRLYVYCHSAYLTYRQSISCEMLDWMTQKLVPRLLGEIA